MMKIFVYLIMLNFLVFVNLKFLMFMMFNLIFFLNLMFLFYINYNNYWMSIYSWMGMDNLSLVMLILTIWVISLVFISSIKFKNLKFYSLIILMLMISLFLSFISMNYFMFYLFFEISLIPTFMLIMGWGYQPERINASMFMMLYTMFASLPLLILLYYLFMNLNSLNYMMMLNNNLNLNLNNFITMFYMMFAFLIKLPMFMFHLWLPKAHIEAPVTGSMILAAILLKLGGYGCIRSMMMMMNLMKIFSFLLIGICIFGMIYLSILNLRCNDYKLIVAYSSIIHMAMMLLGLISMSSVGFIGGILMMIGHGFCSSALFFMVNIFYDRLKSRNLMINKGMILFLPTMIMWWFMFCVINMAAPISLNLMSEIFVLVSMFMMSKKMMLIFSLGMYFSAMYSLYLFSYSSHGNFSNLNVKFNINLISEYLNLLLHWIPLNLMILKLEFFM